MITHATVWPWWQTLRSPASAWPGELDWLMIERGKPKLVVSDNSSELTSNALLTRADHTRFDGHYIAPGKPTQNAFIESSTAGCIRIVERDAIQVAGPGSCCLRCWRDDYNGARPHSQLGWKTPSEFPFTCTPRRDLALRYAKSSAPAPAALTAQPGKPKSQGELRTG